MEPPVSVSPLIYKGIKSYPHPIFCLVLSYMFRTFVYEKQHTKGVGYDNPRICFGTEANGHQRMDQGN